MNTSTRRRGWLAATLIFILGFSAGTAVTLIIGARVLKNLLREPASSPAFIDRAMQRTYTNFVGKLDLNPEESARMQTEFRAMADHIKQIRFETMQRVVTETREAAEHIATTLPPEKQEAFRKLANERFATLGLAPLPSPSK